MSIIVDEQEQDEETISSFTFNLHNLSAPTEGRCRDCAHWREAEHTTMAVGRCFANVAHFFGSRVVIAVAGEPLDPDIPRSELLTPPDFGCVNFSGRKG